MEGAVRVGRSRQELCLPIIEPPAPVVDDCRGGVPDVQGVGEVLNEETPQLVALRRGKTCGNREDLACSVECCRHKHDPIVPRCPECHVQCNDLWTMGPGTSTGTRTRERHGKPAFFLDNVGHGSWILFTQGLEQSRQLVTRPFLVFQDLPGFCDGLHCSGYFHFDAVFLAEDFL